MIVSIPSSTVPYIEKTLIAIAKSGLKEKNEIPAMATVNLKDKETGEPVSLSFVLMRGRDGLLYESVGKVEIDGKCKMALQVPLRFR